VSVLPSWNQQSLRSPHEAEEYNHQMVEAIGIVQAMDDEALMRV